MPTEGILCPLYGLQGPFIGDLNSWLKDGPNHVSRSYGGEVNRQHGIEFMNYKPKWSFMFGRWGRSM
jgi:hypothetical protein